jgi:hypothetical protein
MAKHHFIGADQMNRFCWLAFIYQDKKTASLLLRVIKGSENPTIWGTQETIEQAKTWATQ